jgi:hypothetical protein
MDAAVDGVVAISSIGERLPADLLEQLPEVIDVSQVSVLRRHLVSGDRGRGLYAGERLVLEAIERAVDGWKGQLVYDADLWKSMLGDEVNHLATLFPELTIEHAADDEWNAETIAAVHTGSSQCIDFDRPLEFSLPVYLAQPHRPLFGHIDDLGDRHDGAVDDDGWQSFGFDVTDADYEFEWSDQPCSCTRCALAGGGKPASKNGPT